LRTAKYRPEFPAKGCASLDEARAWAAEYRTLLAARHALYLPARQRHPARGSGNARDGSHIGVVALNPERAAMVNMPVNAQHTQQAA